MRSLLFSAVVGMATLGLFVGTADEAQARPRDRAEVQSTRGRDNYYGGGYYGRGYYGRGYYGGYYGPSYYGSSYYYPATTTQSYYYPPGDASRYQYYWSNGWYICYDRTTGEYWYQSNGKWYVWQ